MSLIMKYSEGYNVMCTLYCYMKICLKTSRIEYYSREKRLVSVRSEGYNI
jgi:hypothetical protein